MIDTTRITLAIESAIGGGSISLLDGEREVANWIGETNVLRAAEDLLPQIDSLIRANDMTLGEIGLIAVSAGPGSFTGIRIGLSSALGLKTGLGVPLASQSALKSMAFALPYDGDVIVCVPAGRKAVCWQRFEKSGAELVEINSPTAIAEDDLRPLAENNTESTIVIHSALAKKVASPNVLDFGTNIAQAIGSYCRRSPAVVTEPLFISKSF